MSDILLDLQALKKGDEQAWSRAFQTLYRFAYRAALTPRAQLSPDEAQEVAVDALTKLVPIIDTVTNERQLVALLVIIANRRAISVARRRSALKRPQIAVPIEMLAESESAGIAAGDGVESPWKAAAASEMLKLLHEMLEGLDPTTRALLISHHLEGSTFHELSQKFGLPSGTVSVKISRGLQKLRTALKRSSTLLKELNDYLR